MEDSKRILAEETLKALQEIEDTMKVEDIIKDNMIKFEVDKIQYRLRQPSIEDNQDLFKRRRVKYLELVRDDSYLFRKQWTETYKKKGIDIDKMDKEMKEIQDKREKFAIRLAQLVDSPSIQTLKTEIIALSDKLTEIAYEKADLLAYSIEDQLNIFATSYLCYLVLEKLENDKWERLFPNYEDFNKTDNKVTTKALSLINYLIYRVE